MFSRRLKFAKASPHYSAALSSAQTRSCYSTNKVSTAKSKLNVRAMRAKGVEEVIQIKLTAEENAALQKSSAPVRELVTVLGF
jgi:malate/lactate dehydrogenase